ncbi:uncharacterized protein C8Q71DRAFT_514959 [Rhodofomes roseus]|uniref:Secreted protein n=1 Tax=Rhodofomes roseus TaxID=34475 RepID=A0ABQ8KMF4_9APHY|nr:uncharacterized protein C8Q71DRAFT_514959 [Rhodofomes roseus]KAH9839504.1 hypothetical protein C8Q71DRAFT_514959 [Rhodofomes roseus]
MCVLSMRGLSSSSWKAATGSTFISRHFVQASVSKVLAVMVGRSLAVTALSCSVQRPCYHHGLERPLPRSCIAPASESLVWNQGETADYETTIELGLVIPLTLRSFATAACGTGTVLNLSSISVDCSWLLVCSSRLRFSIRVIELRQRIQQGLARHRPPL